MSYLPSFYTIPLLYPFLFSLSIQKANFPKSHMGPQLQLRHLPSPLPINKHLPRNNPPILRLRRRPFNLSSPHALPPRHNNNPHLRHPHHAPHRRIPANPVAHRRFLCYPYLAPFSLPRPVFWLGNGVFVRGYCRHRAAVVYD